MQTTGIIRVKLQESHASSIFYYFFFGVGGRRGEVEGKETDSDLLSDFLASDRVHSDYTSIIEINPGSLPLGYLIVSHIFVTARFFVEL